MLFRIGINLGDVIHDETRIYGDGINIAARLEALAEPGGVLVSNTVYEQIRDKLPFFANFILIARNKRNKLIAPGLK